MELRPYLFCLFFCVFYIFPTSFWRQWAAFLGAWYPLPAFRSCFVEFTQRLSVLLMNLWGRKCSPHPIPPPSSGNQSWTFIGRTYAEAEAPTLWPPDVKNWLSGKDPDAGKKWRQKEKGMTKDELVGWRHQLHGHKFEWALGVGDGQGSLACCSPWGHKELDMTEWLNWIELWRLMRQLKPRVMMKTYKWLKASQAGYSIKCIILISLYALFSLHFRQVPCNFYY